MRENRGGEKREGTGSGRERGGICNKGRDKERESTVMLPSCTLSVVADAAA